MVVNLGMSPFNPERHVQPKILRTCVRCAQVEDLQQLTELQETVKGLCAIWEAGIEMVSQIHVQSALNTQYGPKQP